MTFIPHFSAYPPETSWIPEPRTKLPALVLQESGNGARRAYLSADVDRRFSRDNLPDHGHLLANLIRWGAKMDIPLRVEGTGLIDCNLYHQSGRLVLHLVNLTSAGTWKAPVHELIPIGPLQVSVRLTEDVRGEGVQFLVSGETRPAAYSNGWATFEVKSLLDHEVAVIA